MEAKQNRSVRRKRNMAKPTNCSRTHMPWRLCGLKRIHFWNCTRPPRTRTHIARPLFRTRLGVVSLTGSQVENRETEKKEQRVGGRRRWMNSRITVASSLAVSTLFYRLWVSEWVPRLGLLLFYIHILIWMINFQAKEHKFTTAIVAIYLSIRSYSLWVLRPVRRLFLNRCQNRNKKTTGEI